MVFGQAAVLQRLEASRNSKLQLCTFSRDTGNGICPTQAAVVQQLPELLDQNPKARACICACTDTAFHCRTNTEVRGGTYPAMPARHAVNSSSRQAET